MTRQKNWLAHTGHLGLHKVTQLLHQMRPVVGDGVLRVVTKLLDGTNREAARLQAFEQNAVGAGRKTVGVGEDDQISFSSGVLIFFRGWLRPDCVISGTAVCSPFHIGSSMLSNTSRSFCPQLPCNMRK